MLPSYELNMELRLIKILLLEDDPNLAKSLVKYLKRNDYDVVWAKQGEEAIDLS